MNRSRLASRNRPIARHEAPVITALRIRAAETVTSRPPVGIHFASEDRHADHQRERQSGDDAPVPGSDRHEETYRRIPEQDQANALGRVRRQGPREDKRRECHLGDEQSRLGGESRQTGLRRSSRSARHGDRPRTVQDAHSSRIPRLRDVPELVLSWSAPTYGQSRIEPGSLVLARATVAKKRFMVGPWIRRNQSHGEPAGIARLLDDGVLNDGGKREVLPVYGRRDQGINVRTKKPATSARLTTLCQSSCTVPIFIGTGRYRSRAGG